jgi:hypothetical protein
MASFLPMGPHFGRKNIFKNGRNPTWISANISNSYVLNKFSLWFFGGGRGPERGNRPKPASVTFSHHQLSMDNQIDSAKIVQKKILEN